VGRARTRKERGFNESEVMGRELRVAIATPRSSDWDIDREG
jgi:hypothetical protein